MGPVQRWKCSEKTSVNCTVFAHVPLRRERLPLHCCSLCSWLAGEAQRGKVALPEQQSMLTTTRSRFRTALDPAGTPLPPSTLALLRSEQLEREGTRGCMCQVLKCPEFRKKFNYLGKKIYINKSINIIISPGTYEPKLSGPCPSAPSGSPH